MWVLIPKYIIEVDAEYHASVSIDASDSATFQHNSTVSLKC